MFLYIKKIKTTYNNSFSIYLHICHKIHKNPQKQPDLHLPFLWIFVLSIFFLHSFYILSAISRYR